MTITTLADLQADLQERLAPGTEVELVGEDDIYVNFDFSRALVLTLSEGTVEIMDCAWDRTHGLEHEEFIAQVRPYLASTVVAEFLRQKAEDDALMEQLIDARE